MKASRPSLLGKALLGWLLVWQSASILAADEAAGSASSIALDTSLARMTTGDAIPGGFAVPAAISGHQKRTLTAAGRPLKDWQLSDLAVVATLDGSLHAVDRATGETRWKIDSATSAIQSAYPNQTRKSLLQDDRETWILEPIEDGGLYVFSTNNGLQKLPFGIKQLVENSPFTIPGDDKVYVGERKTTLYSIDPSSGNILQAYGTDFSQSAAKSPKCSPRDGFDELEEDEECRLADPNARNVLKIGRNTYTLTIFSGTEVVWNMTYAEWIPNTIDRDLGRQYATTFDGLYISPLHDGRLIAHQTETNDALWYREMTTPVVRVYDVLHQYERSRAFNNELVGVAVVTQPLDPHFDEKDHENYVDGEGATFVGLTDAGDWFALSAAKCPLVKSAASSKWSEGLGQGRYADLLGVHSHNKVPRQEMKVPGQMLTIDGTPAEQQRTIGGQTGLQTRSFDTSATVIIGILSSLLMIALGLLFTRSSSSKLAVLSRFNLTTQAQPDLATPRAQVHFADRVAVPDEKQPLLQPVDPNPQASGEESPPAVEVEPPLVPESAVEVPETLADSVKSVAETPTKPKRKRGSRGSKKSKVQTVSAVTSDNSNEDEDTDKGETAVKSMPVQPMVSVDGLLTIGSLQVTDKILGYGSHGTIVYKGSFEGRDVAVKRMLLDFYDIASHEVVLLQESDDHPNVIRYYCKQQNERFLYIALELCAASLAEVTERPAEFQPLADCMHDLVSVLRQMVLGIQYLHSLKIVHRDLKPQNILVNMPRKSVVPQKNDGRCARLVISDFGLCKKLDADQSSFRATTAQAAGTSGWRAPELLLDDLSDQGPRESSTSGSATVNGTGQLRKVSRAIDIFSLGCVFYYVLSGGAHPFGDKYMREANIIRNRASLTHLDLLGDIGILARDLIARMILPNPKDRPDASTVLQHPFFWTAERRLNFLLDVSDRFEVEERDPPSPLLLLLEAPAQDVVGDNWASKLDRHFLENLGKYRKYKGHSIMDLLRAMRNKKHHYQDLPDQVQQALGPLPHGFLSYFTSRFPLLILHAYYLTKEHLHEEAMFSSYFQ